MTEQMQQQQGDGGSLDDTTDALSSVEDDKTFALMGVTKTIQTVCNIKHIYSFAYY